MKCWKVKMACAILKTLSVPKWLHIEEESTVNLYKEHNLLTLRGSGENHITQHKYNEIIQDKLIWGLSEEKEMCVQTYIELKKRIIF